MSNDKDSAVLADQTLATAYRDWRLSTTASPIHYKPMALAFVAGWKAALRQPTQSDALREENERLREHLISALDTLKDAEVCDDNCGPCNEARAAL